MNESIKKLAKKIRVSEGTINFLLIFILGFLVGIAIKTEARGRITIGYDDYLARQMRQDFDLMKKDNPEQSGANQNTETPAPAGEQGAPAGGQQ